MGKLGKPRPNQLRLITKKEKVVLKVRTHKLSVRGTQGDFELLDSNGELYPIAEDQRVKLMHFWEVPILNRWNNSNFLRS